MALATTHPNLALDSEVKATIKRDLLPLLRHTRQNRRALREQWLRYYRIWAVTPDQEAYQGRVQNYIPMGRRICEHSTAGAATTSHVICSRGARLPRCDDR